MPEKILVIDNSTFFVTCRIGEEPQDVQDMQWFWSEIVRTFLQTKPVNLLSWMLLGLQNRRKENGLAAGIF